MSNNHAPPHSPIPQTQILSEASLNSLQEVLSLDPERYTTAHREAAITALREWRTRIAAADAAGKRVARAPRVAPQQIAAPGTTAKDLF